jgi:hypothetical protein
VLQSHLEGVFKSGLTSGSLALAGDVFAQLLTSHGKVRAKSHAISERCGLIKDQQAVFKQPPHQGVPPIERAAPFARPPHSELAQSLVLVLVAG